MPNARGTNPICRIRVVTRPSEESAFRARCLTVRGSRGCRRSDRESKLVLFILEIVGLGQHARVEDPGNENSPCPLAIEDDVPSAFDPPQSGADDVARPSERRVACQSQTASLEFAEVAVRLHGTPGSQGIVADTEEVGFRLK